MSGDSALDDCASPDPEPGHTSITRKHTRTTISTLDPARLSESDYIPSLSKQHNIVYITQPTPDPSDPSISDNSSERARRARLLLPHLCFKHLPAARFPPDAHGFLYYHRATSAPPLSGDVRFRVTSTPDPRSFAAGHDLHEPASGLVWRIPLLRIAHAPSPALRARLLADALVSQRELDAARAVTLPVCAVHAFGQPFVVNMARAQPDLLFVGWGRSVRVRVHAQPIAWSPEHPALVAPWPGGLPFRGAAVCRFEKSPLREHLGRRVVVCRVAHVFGRKTPRAFVRRGASVDDLKALRAPRERDFLRWPWSDGRLGPVWAVDVDGGQFGTHDFARGLRVLYENEERAEVLRGAARPP